MPETKKIPEPVPVNTEKLIDGIATIFSGVIQLLSSMEPEMAQQLADAAIKGVQKEQTPETFNPDDFEEIFTEDGLPWDTEPEQAEPPKEQPKKKAASKKQQPPAELTADDLIRVVTQKIKKDRSNKEKVLSLLKSYGAAKVSDVPPDKYEAFLTDLSQL